MQLGLNLAVFGDRPLERALDDAAALGIDTIELNTESGDALTPIQDLLRKGRAREVMLMVRARGLSVSALGNHAEGQLIGGPWHQDTDRIHKGNRAEKVAWGVARLQETIRVASELEVGTVITFIGCEDWSRFFPWPDPEGFEGMIPGFVETWTPYGPADGPPNAPAIERHALLTVRARVAGHLLLPRADELPEQFLVNFHNHPLGHLLHLHNS